jgi:AcrR family transcriptional regulator
MAERQEDPRANQKARTRAAIIHAAQELQAQGEAPTIVRVAEAARVSRATAYRYFPTQEALLVDLDDLIPAARRTEQALDRLNSDDVEERLLVVLDTFDRIMLDEEASMRRSLWVSLDTWLRNHRNGDRSAVPVREGRRMRWLDKVLTPLHDLPDDQRRRLQAALALTIGMDGLVVMKDVCRLDNDEALAVLRWAATSLLHTALNDNRPPELLAT